MHLGSGPGSDIVLHNVDIETPDATGDIQVINRGNLPQSLFAQIRVRRLPRHV